MLRTHGSRSFWRLGRLTPPSRGYAISNVNEHKALGEQADSGLDAWIKILGEKMTDRHDSIRDSARAALVAIGEPALPALKQLAQSDDSATATAARKVIAQIGDPRRGGMGRRDAVCPMPWRPHRCAPGPARTPCRSSGFAPPYGEPGEG